MSDADPAALVALPGFAWLPGMRWRSRDGRFLGRSEGEAPECTGALPDLDDDATATRGCGS